MKKKLSIQEAREKAGMTLGDAALAMGISKKKLAWYEENPDEMEFDDATALCRLYGCKFDDVSFTLQSDKEVGTQTIYPPARRLNVVIGMKKKVADILLSITNDDQYSERHLYEDLVDLMHDVTHEEEVTMNELEAGIVSITSKNHLNLSLAGR
ncbi:helix-turn-helix domain-containing protein [Paenibacillus campinasensis]|uniref:HTH cro/C1-type domain-containing protein n=1 Tax=Paenibacillus campinasensis TaxID=66347 RepID=A0A268EKR6_9BACL|nr:helix-turn-helix transcriptional regulator [Paenibacillus campinasensis]PAD73695.1 hypothetical protein CHH67_19870 [Paenibacillus campinasensis]